MWEKLKKAHPWLSELVDWVVLGLAAGSFLLSLSVYLETAYG